MATAEIEIQTRTRTQPTRQRPSFIVDSEPEKRREQYGLEGLWRSQGGSLYLCDGRSFVCVGVHSAAFRGWIGRVAVRLVRKTAGGWLAEQAFRSGHTGALTDWQPITVVVAEDTITKYFPQSLSSAILLYGHVEHYYRVRLQ
jgi:hypothetical protein